MEAMIEAVMVITHCLSASWRVASRSWPQAVKIQPRFIRELLY
jgi:hypothetical protein